MNGLVAKKVYFGVLAFLVDQMVLLGLNGKGTRGVHCPKDLSVGVLLHHKCSIEQRRKAFQGLTVKGTVETSSPT